MNIDEAPTIQEVLEATKPVMDEKREITRKKNAYYKARYKAKRKEMRNQ